MTEILSCPHLFADVISGLFLHSYIITVEEVYFCCWILSSSYHSYWCVYYANRYVVTFWNDFLQFYNLIPLVCIFDERTDFLIPDCFEIDCLYVLFVHLEGDSLIFFSYLFIFDWNPTMSTLVGSCDFSFVCACVYSNCRKSWFLLLDLVLFFSSFLLICLLFKPLCYLDVLEGFFAVV